MAYNRFTDMETKIIIGFINRNSSNKIVLRQLTEAFPLRSYPSLYVKMHSLIETSPDVLLTRGVQSPITSTTDRPASATTTPVIRKIETKTTIRLEDLNDECLISLIHVKIKTTNREKLISILFSL